jgi:hypothetical protein
LIIFVTGFFLAFAGCIRGLRSKFESIERKQVFYVGLAFTMLMAIACATSNVFDMNTVGHLAFLLAGIAAPLRNEIIPSLRPMAAARGIRAP